MTKGKNSSNKELALNLLSFFGWILILGFLAVTLWVHLGPKKPLPDKARQRAAENVITQITEEIRIKRGSINQVVLLHFANDYSDFFTTSLRTKLNSSGILDLKEASFLEKFKSKVNLRNDGYSNKKMALKAAAGEKADGILWGRLDKFESFEGGVVVKGEWGLIDLKTDDTVCGGVIDVDTSKKISSQINKKLLEMKRDLEPWESAAQLVPWHIRLLIFILVVLLLPILTISFLRTMVAKRSNKINAFVLGVYTMIGAILAFFMIGAIFLSILSVILFLTATLIAFFYNAYLMCVALKLES